MPKYIEITEDEAWAVDHTIRHTYAEGPNNIGKDLLLKVMTVVLEFEDRRGKPLAPQVLPLALTEDESWAIDHQIRCDLTVNGKPIGRSLLLKVFRALSQFANERDSESGVAQLGSLADLLRPPPEEEIPGGANGTRGPTSGIADPDGPAGRADRDADRGPSEHRPPPDDGAPGPLPRGK